MQWYPLELTFADSNMRSRSPRRRVQSTSTRRSWLMQPEHTPLMKAVSGRVVGIKHFVQRTRELCIDDIAPLFVIGHSEDFIIAGIKLAFDAANNPGTEAGHQ